VINRPHSGHYGAMGDVSVALSKASVPTPDRAGTLGPADPGRMRSLVEAQFDFIWRLLRRLGVPAPSADDAAQQVFLVAAAKIGPVARERERSFLFAVAIRVAAGERRHRKRHPDSPRGLNLAEVKDESPGPEELLDQARARAIMQQILDRLPLEQRVVFVLYELEDMTNSEIAELLRVPSGTVASRLRRGRAAFEQAVDRLRARGVRVGAP
jgi:RNA polymerase sigma-70 factor (ECF subfamily)